MVVARIGTRGCTSRDHASGRVDTLVTGISTGFGGTEPPIFVSTGFDVDHAIANLALEYDDIDASAIYSFGNDLNALEIKISYPASGEGFYIEYAQKDPNAESRLVSNWYALSVKGCVPDC